MKAVLSSFFAAIFLIVLMTASSCSGKKQEIRRNIRELESHSVAIPAEMLLIKDGQMVFDRDTMQYHHQLLIWVSPEECSECRIAHLAELSPVREEISKHPSVDMKVILSPREADVKSIINKIVEIKPEGKIFVDSDGLFGLMNQFIPAGVMYHTFLLDENNVPILVGNPLSGEKMFELFKKTIE